jgi:hypothetical protein
MKTSILKTAFAFLAFTIASCSSDDSNDNSTATPSADKTTFKLNGTLITADETTATHYTNSVAGGKYIDVFVSKGGKEVLELHFPAVAGTYPAQQNFNMTTSWLTYEANGGVAFPADFFHSTSGEIKVTTLDVAGKKIRATFNFVGNNSTTNATITEGVLVVNAITVQ